MRLSNALFPTASSRVLTGKTRRRRCWAWRTGSKGKAFTSKRQKHTPGCGDAKHVIPPAVSNILFLHISRLSVRNEDVFVVCFRSDSDAVHGVANFGVLFWDIPPSQKRGGVFFVLFCPIHIFGPAPF